MLERSTCRRHLTEAGFHSGLFAAPALLVANGQPQYLAELLEMRLHAATAVWGVCLVSRNFAAAALAAGQLQSILGDWTLPPLKTYALVPNRSLHPTKTRLLLDGLERHFAATEQPAVHTGSR